MRRTHWSTKSVWTCVRNVVGDLLSRPSHRHCRHRCERPLRMDAPSTGWVTVLAGLLARGSPPSWSGLPSFPVAVLDLRLAAHSCGGSHGLLRIRKARIRSVRVPSFVPESPGKRASENVPLSLRLSQADHGQHAAARSCYSSVAGTRLQAQIVFVVSAALVISRPFAGELPP